MKLTESFSLSEMTRSYQAEKHGIINKPSNEIVKALRNLCERVLQPLRDFYGKPIIVSSGYRCITLNCLVGGSRTSQHLKGEAADLVFPDLSVAVDWMCFINHNCDFDQMLLERNNRTGVEWLHVSCKMDVSRNRREIKILNV